MHKFLLLYSIIGLAISEAGAQTAPTSAAAYFGNDSSLSCKNLSTLPQSLNVAVYGTDGELVFSSALLIAPFQSATLEIPSEVSAGTIVATNSLNITTPQEINCRVGSVSGERVRLEAGNVGNTYFAVPAGGELRLLNASSGARSFKVNVFSSNGSFDYSKSPGDVSVAPNASATYSLGTSGSADVTLVEIISDSSLPYNSWVSGLSAAQSAQVCGPTGQGATFLLRGKSKSNLILANTSDAVAPAVLELKDISGAVFAQTDVTLRPKSSQSIDLTQFSVAGQSPVKSVDLKCSGGGKLVGTLKSGDDNIPAQPIGNLRAGTSGLYEFRDKNLLMVGDSVSQAFSELGTDFNYDIYLQLLKERGIGSFMIWSYIAGNNQLTDERIGYAAPRIFPWINEGGNSLKFSFVNAAGKAVFNEKYFDRLRDLVESANEKGIVVVVTVHDGWAKTRFDGHPMNRNNGGFISEKEDYVRLHSYTEEMPDLFNPSWNNLQKHQFVLEQFTKRIVDTLAVYPNVALEVFNEGEWYPEKSLISFQQHFSRLIRERSALPIVINRDSQSDPIVQTAEVSGLSVHSPRWSSRTLTSSTAKQISRYTVNGAPAKPVLFTEPVPEYHGRDVEGMVRLMWGTLLAKSGFFVPNDTLWKISLTSAPDPIFIAVGTASKLVNQAGIDIGRMVVGSAEDCGGNACLLVPQEEYLIYYEGQHQVELNLSGAPGQNYAVKFLNPITGVMIPDGASVSSGGTVNISLPSADEDWVVWVKRQ